MVAETEAKAKADGWRKMVLGELGRRRIEERKGAMPYAEANPSSTQSTKKKKKKSCRVESLIRHRTIVDR